MKTNKSKIIAHAIELIAQKGYDAVSIRAIAGAVGIKESSFYNHFKSKEALLQEIFRITEENINNLRVGADELEKLCVDMTLREFLTFNLNRLIDEWHKPDARNLWYVLSQQQYKSKQAALLILQQMEKSIELFEVAFSYFMRAGKMHKGNAARLAELYGMSMHAAHLKATYLIVVEDEQEFNFATMHSILNEFVEQYTKK